MIIFNYIFNFFHTINQRDVSANAVCKSISNRFNVRYTLHMITHDMKRGSAQLNVYVCVSNVTRNHIQHDDKIEKNTAIYAVVHDEQCQYESMFISNKSENITKNI